MELRVRMRALLLAVAVAAALVALAARADAQTIASTKLVVRNRAGLPIDLFWKSLHPPFERVRQTTTSIRNGSETTINTYETHAFVITYTIAGVHPSNPALTMVDVEAEVEYVHGKGDSLITVYWDDQAGRLAYTLQDKLKELRSDVHHASSACRGRHPKLGEQYVECIADAVVGEVSEVQQRLQLERNLKHSMAELLRNYTCADPNMDTSEPVAETVFRRKGKTYPVKRLLETSHANIWLVENFITPEECDAVESHTRSRLHRATVSASEGGSEVSEHRKAQQASYDVDLNNPEDPLYDFEFRIFDLVNHHTQYGLSPEGQETFTVIQYEGANRDEYRPHCDGACDGLDFKQGAREATVVTYCRTAEEGGGTTFSKAGVFVKPERYSAVMFSYVGPDGRTDDGLTEHSGCPVTKGEKWLITRWLRGGVSAQEPWTRWDPSGNLER